MEISMKYAQYCVNPTEFGDVRTINCRDTYVNSNFGG